MIFFSVASGFASGLSRRSEGFLCFRGIFDLLHLGGHDLSELPLKMLVHVCSNQAIGAGPYQKEGRDDVVLAGEGNTDVEPRPPLFHGLSGGRVAC